MGYFLVSYFNFEKIKMFLESQKPILGDLFSRTFLFVAYQVSHIIPHLSDLI